MSSTLRDIPALGEILGHRACCGCGPGELQRSHFGWVFIGSQDDWLWLVFPILAATQAVSFWYTVQAGDGPSVARGQMATSVPVYCTSNQGNNGSFPKVYMAYPEI